MSPCRRSQARNVTELTPVRCDTVRIGKKFAGFGEGAGFRARHAPESN